jgi:hypothetical protein
VAGAVAMAMAISPAGRPASAVQAHGQAARGCAAAVHGAVTSGPRRSP